MFAPLVMGAEFGSSDDVEREARADAAQVEAAHVEDAAEEVARKMGTPCGIGARDEARTRCSA